MLALFGAGIIALVAFIAFKSIYNVFFHPLRSYPGRLLWRISPIPKAYHVIRGDLHFQLMDMHNKYGHVVRTEPNQLTYTDPNAPREIAGFGTKEKKGDLTKDPAHYNAVSVSGATSILGANNEDHRRLRRLQSHAFSDKALTAQEDLLQGFTKLLIDELRLRAETAEHNGVVDMTSWFNFLTFDLIGDLAFGESFGCLESGELNPWIECLNEGFSVTNAYLRALRILPFSGVLRKLLIPKRLKIARKQNVQWSGEKVERRIATQVDRPDFLSYILKYNDTEKGMTLAELKEASVVFIFAGSETTATLLSGLLFYLLTNPHTMQQLCDEIRTTFKTPEDITILATARLPYLRAVIEEGLRIYPPVPSVFPRVSPAGGTIICGQYVPEGTSVATPQYPMHHSPRNFLLPEEFHPERWLGDEKFAGDKLQCMQAFSMGSRNCIGKNLAYTEIRLAMSRLLFEFDLELLDESRNWNDQIMHSLWEKGPLMVKLSKRSIS